MGQQSTERSKSLANPLADPAWQPVFDVIRKVVFRRDREATQITLDDFRESLRFLKVRADAKKFLTKEIGAFPEAANEDEFRRLLGVDNSKQQRLRFDDAPGMLFKKALQRYEDFVSLLPLSGRGQLQHVFHTLFSAAKKIPGQEAAAHEVAQMLAVSLTDSNRTLPASVFLHGPHGSGSREMSAAIGQSMAGLGYALLEIDLSQYRNEGEEASIRGAKPYWSGSREGIATGFVYQHPKAVIVVHNADRSLPRVLEAFLQPLTSGNWVDQYGLEDTEDGPPRSSSKRPPTTVDCRQAVFIFNAAEGSQWYQNPDHLKFLDSQFGKGMMVEAMRDATQDFRGETLPVFHGPLLDQLSESLVLLKPVAWEHLRAAAKGGLQQASRKISRRFSCQLSVKNARAIADLHLLRTAPAQGISACNGKSFEEGILSSFASWCINKEAHAAAKLDIDPASLGQLEKILAELGSDPVATLKRKTQSLLYSVALEEDEITGVSFVVRDISLQKTPRLKDFTGEIHLEASVPDVRFDDVAGHTEVKDFFREMIGYLRRPALVSAIGVDLPKGVLLYGPPGTGKTKLAQCFSGEAGLPFIAITGADLLYPQRISELYRIAQSAAPCVIFIDEVDVIGKRGQQGAAHDAAINTLLTSIQGFSSQRPIFHIMATNRAHSLDEALVRPGRIDRKFYCGALDRDARADMMQRLIKVTKISPAAIDRLLPLTYGMTGAEMEQVIREAGLRRLRLEADRALSVEEVIDEINTQKFGEKRRSVSFDSTTRRRVALHEIGHAVLLSIRQPELPIEVVTITPRNNTAGFVSVNAENFELAEETPNAVRTFLACRVAGRAAEMIAYGDEGRSSGATSDLSIATRAAYRAVAYSGLDAEMPIGSILGFSEFGENTPAPLVHKAWERTQIWLHEAEKEASQVLQAHWPLVEHLTDMLLEKEHINGEEFAELVARFKAEQASSMTSGEQS